MDAFIKVFNKNLDQLTGEINGFQKEYNLWKTTGNVSNSAGNLCLHLIGNLNHFIGAVIGDSGYIRDRKAEFEDKNIMPDELCLMIQNTKIEIGKALLSFNKETLKMNYPIKVFGEEMSYEFFLMHLISHLSYHLGQINYLRRILESNE